MKKISTLVPVAFAGVLLAAMVLAAPVGRGLIGTPTKAPNRAEVFAATTCGQPASSIVADAQSWHIALASKRVLDRAVTLAATNPDLAKGCDSTDA